MFSCLVMRKKAVELYRRYEWIRRVDNLRTSLFGMGNTLKYKYPHHVLFIAGMAKSGSSWVHAFLLTIPGFQRPPIVDRSAIAKGKVWKESYFTDIPKFGYYALKTHAAASSDLLAILRRMNLSTIVTYRDIRDQLVSRFHHIIVDPNSLHYKLYNELPQNEAFSHSVEYALDTYIKWVDNWLAVIEKDPNKFLVIRYEDLLDDTFEVFRKVLLFYGLDFPEYQIREMMIKADAITRGGVDNLADRVKVGRGANFRAGRKGDWRTHFSNKDVEVVKKYAGEQLIRLGYEKDMNWGL